jgi:hypothetical protein
MQAPYPFWQQLLFVSVGSPVVALLFKLGARGWATTVQGDRVSEKTATRQRIEFLAMLLSMWIVGIGVVVLNHYFPNLLPRSNP